MAPEQLMLDGLQQMNRKNFIITAERPVGERLHQIRLIEEQHVSRR
jgi:hypothetical protein